MGFPLIPRKRGNGGCALDDYADVLTRVYCPGVRLLSSYGGALLRVRRDSDQAESDFYAGSDDLLDKAAIAAWLGGADGYLPIIYEQKGSGYNLARTSAANQPKYQPDGINGLMSTEHVSASNQRMVAGGLTISKPITYYSVAQLTAGLENNNTGYHIHSGTVHDYNPYMHKGGGLNPDWFGLWGGGAYAYHGVADSDRHIFSSRLKAGDYGHYMDGTIKSTATAGCDNNIGLAWAGSRKDQYCWDGWLSAILVHDGEHDNTTMLAIQDALNDYFETY